MTQANPHDGPLPDDRYRGLADFRYEVRRFFAFSDNLLKTASLPQKQYQALLEIRAKGRHALVSTSELADRLHIRLNSAVELVDRLEKAGLVVRERSADDRRRIAVRLSDKGDATLAPLAARHAEQHHRQLADFSALVRKLAPES